uniref:Glycosyl transferase family 28 C-terminal domain-containing protein n=1 Tax=Zea mays TaxID=4577 RepID=A0A804M4G9_MAIZE
MHPPRMPQLPKRHAPASPSPLRSRAVETATTILQLRKSFAHTPPGSGSIFETLRLGKPLIVVINKDLMDNHQSELAEELAERKHLFCARPQTLGETIRAMDLETLVPYEPGDAKPVVALINRFLGFPVG